MFVIRAVNLTMSSVEPLNTDIQNSGLEASSSYETDGTKPKSRLESIRNIFRFNRKYKRGKKLKHKNAVTQSEPDLFDYNNDSETENEEPNKESNVIKELCLSLETLRQTVKDQAKAIKQLATNCKVTGIHISRSSNFKINLVDDEVEESIQCIDLTMKHLIDKSSKMEGLLYEMREKIDSLDKRNGESDIDELQQLKLLASKIDAITSKEDQCQSSVVYSQTCDARYIDDKEDVHCWLPGREFRKLIRSQSEQSVAQHDLMENQIDMKDVVLDNNRLLRELVLNKRILSDNIPSEEK